GKPLSDPKAVSVPAKDLAPLAGVYANAWKEEFNVWVNATNVQISGPGIGRVTVLPLSPDVFFISGSQARIEFKRNAKGVPNEASYKAGYGPDLRFIRTAKPLPGERKAVAIDPKLLDLYAGEYELQPGFTVKFFRQGGKFMTQATGQGAVEIFPESETKFFLKVVDGQVEFIKDAAGKVTSMVLTQNGRAMPAKRIEK
ncbi:MAG: DUF3471 domain-containing protein, partial [Acidobacteriota bacterium]|nr:DUF3471 domain-containing protein [Acidobacteriota bacterium]